MDAEIPLEIMNSLNEVIQESEPLVAVKVMRQQDEELFQGIQMAGQASNCLRSLVVGLQDKLDDVSPLGTRSGNLDPRDSSPQPRDEQSSELRSP